MIEEASRTWTLRRGDRVIAEIAVGEIDMFWMSGTITRLPGFEEIEPFFAEDLVFLNNPDPSTEDIAHWEALSEEFEAHTDLLDPSGQVIAEFLMHVDGDEASWRWSLEPFD